MCLIEMKGGVTVFELVMVLMLGETMERNDSLASRGSVACDD